jgi:hypothetical protein
MGSQTAAGSSLALSAMLPSSFDAAGYAALTYVEIGQVEKLGSFGASFAKVEFQALKGAKQKFKGSADYGALQPSIALDALDAGQILLQTASDDETQKLYSFRVTFPDGSQRYFRGRVFGAPETADGADSMLMATPTVEICSKVVKLEAGVTPTPSPTLSKPSISPTSGAVGTTFTATDGTPGNATITGRRWLLGTTAIGTGTTVTPNAAGSLTRENTAVGTNGETITSTSTAVTVSAATVTPTLALSPTSPSIASNAAVGTLVSNISNVPSGVTPSVTPNDGRLVIAGNASAGWKVVVGMSALSAGTINFAVAATSATSASGVLTITAAAGTIWRTASANTIGQSDSAGSGKVGDWHAYRQSYPIGSGDMAQLRFSLFNWFSNSGNQFTYGTQLVFPELYAVYNGISVRLTQNGNTTITLEAGANRISLDALLPSQFGATRFTRDSLVLLRGVCYRPGVATRVPSSATIQIVADATNNESTWFDSALGLPTNLAATSGAFTTPVYTASTLSYSGTTATIAVAGTDPLPSSNASVTISGATPTGFNGAKTVTAVDTTARTFTYTVASGLAAPTGTVTYTATKFAQTAGLRPVLEGKFVSGDPYTMFIGGDSIDVGLNQSAFTAGPLGIGRNSQALHDPGATTNFTAYMSCAVGGSNVDQFTGTNDLTWPWMSLCRGAMGAHLTNTFGIQATVTASSMLGKMQPWWAKLREMGVEKIVALGAQTRTTTTFTSEADQIVGDGWKAGGNVEQYYALMPGEISAGRITAFLDFQSWRGTDRNKWKIDPVEGTASTDTTHPLGWVHLAEAAELRAVLSAQGMLA